MEAPSVRRRHLQAYHLGDIAADTECVRAANEGQGDCRGGLKRRKEGKGNEGISEIITRAVSKLQNVLVGQFMMVPPSTFLIHPFVCAYNLSETSPLFNGKNYPLSSYFGNYVLISN